MPLGVKNGKTTADFVLCLYGTLKDFLNTEMSCIKSFQVLGLRKSIKVLLQSMRVLPKF